jgi:hypothetical protein
MADAPDPHDKEPQATAPLERIVDDYEPRQDALNWAIDELVQGRPFDVVHAELLNRGWSADDAEGILEEARQYTRPVRNARTREGALRESNRRYRAGMGGGWSVGCFPSITSIIRLIHSMSSISSLRRAKRRDDDATPRDPS